MNTATNTASNSAAKATPRISRKAAATSNERELVEKLSKGSKSVVAHEVSLHGWLEGKAKAEGDKFDAEKQTRHYVGVCGEALRMNRVSAGVQRTWDKKTKAAIEAFAANGKTKQTTERETGPRGAQLFEKLPKGTNVGMYFIDSAASPFHLTLHTNVAGSRDVHGKHDLRLKSPEDGVEFCKKHGLKLVHASKGVYLKWGNDTVAKWLDKDATSKPPTVKAEAEPEKKVVAKAAGKKKADKAAA